MSREYIELSAIKPDGKLYRNRERDTVEALIPNEPFESCHAVDLLELPNGDILAAWFAGSDEGNADISIVISRLKAEESQWSKPVKVSDDELRSEQNPSLFLKSEREIWLMYTAQVSKTPENQLFFNLQYTAEIRCKKSFDNGETWGETVTMFSRPGSFCRQKIQVLSNGRFVFGNWICFPDESRNGSDITVVQISEDEGKNWREVTMSESAGRVHANIIEVRPGELVSLLRSRFADNIYRSVSRDYGDTWTEPVRTELPNNNSSISAIRLNSGALAMVYNPVRYNDDRERTVWPQQRCPVEAAISEDDGITWNFRRVVEPGEGFEGRYNDINNRRYEYPVIMQGVDGKLHIAYSWGTRKNIKYVCVDEEWLRGREICYGAENLAEYPRQRR